MEAIERKGLQFLRVGGMASVEEAISVLGDEGQPRGRRCLAVKAVYLLGDFKQREATVRWEADPAIEKSRSWAWRRARRRDRMGLQLGEWLIGVAEGPDRLEYWEDAKQIGFLGARRATRPLMRVVTESAEPDRRAAALHALWLLGDVRATALCVQVGADHGASEEERLIAVEALGVSADRPFVQRALAGFLGDESAMVRFSALCAIGAAWSTGKRLGPGLREGLERTTQDTTKVYEDGDMAELAARLLGPCDLERSSVRGHL